MTHAYQYDQPNEIFPHGVPEADDEDSWQCDVPDYQAWATPLGSDTQQDKMMTQNNFPC